MERFDIKQQTHEKELLHRTVHVWVVKECGPVLFVLLRKKSIDKNSLPGCCHISCVSHIPEAHEPLASAIRELEQELGIKARPEELELMGTFPVKISQNNEVAFTYLYKIDATDEEFGLQSEKLESFKWFGADTVYLKLLQKDTEFCVPLEGLDMIRKHYYPHCTNRRVRQAKKEIDEILQKYGENCQIAFLRKVAIIIDSYKVSSKEDRHSICKIIEQAGLTERSHENLSAEWKVHNMAYDMRIARGHAKDVDLDYDGDPRFYVKLATDLCDVLDIE